MTNTLRRWQGLANWRRGEDKALQALADVEDDRLCDLSEAGQLLRRKARRQREERERKLRAATASAANASAAPVTTVKDPANDPTQRFTAVHCRCGLPPPLR